VPIVASATLLPQSLCRIRVFERDCPTPSEPRASRAVSGRPGMTSTSSGSSRSSTRSAVRGVSEMPGLYLLGLLWQHSQASASLVGPLLDGPHLVEVIGRQAPRRARGSIEPTRRPSWPTAPCTRSCTLAVAELDRYPNPRRSPRGGPPHDNASSTRPCLIDAGIDGGESHGRVSPLLVAAVPRPTTRPQPNTPSGSYFSFTRRTRSRLPPQ
jgi:hypothetical protein